YEIYIKLRIKIKLLLIDTKFLFDNIKELSMKHDRSLHRIDDEKNLIKNKQIEINLLNEEIQQIQDENKKLENIILQYQPHLNLLAQVNLQEYCRMR
ncbi:unnamed protein product, partial [Rotaria sp. Silwood1]